MSEKDALNVVNKVFKAVFKKDNIFSLEELQQNFAFDIKLPKKVRDSITNEETWADSINNNKFITLRNMEEKDKKTGWMLERKEVGNLDDILKIWNSVNFTTTERVYDSLNVAKSDTIYRCENVYHCTDCSDSKNIIYNDSCGNCEFLIASQRSGNCSFSIRCDDSNTCTNCYSVICSSKISNSFFIQDCFNLEECMFCSHIASKKYCIANMQFEEEEYFAIKEEVIKWILAS